MLTKQEIQYFKSNKHEITEELLATLRSKGNVGKQQALDILDFEKSPDGYYLDAFENRISFNGNRGLKKKFTQLNLSEIHKIEIAKCVEDIQHYKDNYVKIKTPKGMNFPDLRAYQNDFMDTFLDDDNEMVVAKIGRQAGKSITTAIYLSWVYNFKEDLNIRICANKGKLAREFLANVKNILLDLPIWLTHGVEEWNKSSIKNEREMRILTDVPGGDSFRGFTIHVLVVDECAHIKSSIWHEFSDAIFPSQSSLAWKKNIIISTPKGLNHFYDLCVSAKNGSEGIKGFEVDWRDVPRFGNNGEVITPEEFKARVVAKHGLKHFRQNYQCEFIGSSDTLIDGDILSAILESERVEPEEVLAQKLNIYEYPKEGHKYILSVDSSKDGIDDFSLQIIDVTNIEFVQVATANLQIDYLLMPEYINEWGLMYNTAFVIIENNEGSGQSIADMLYLDYEYPSLHFDKTKVNKRVKTKTYPGFRTTRKTRRVILKNLKLFIENGKMKLNDHETKYQLGRFEMVEGKFQGSDGAKDDAVMSLAIAFAPFINTNDFDEMREFVKAMYSKDNVTIDEFIEIGGGGFADF